MGADRRLVLALAALAPLCCARAPSGNYTLAMVQQNKIEAAGRVAADAVEQSWGYREDAIVAYVASVGAQVAASSAEPQRDWRFYVVDVAEPTAFSFADGTVFASRGLLAMLESEDELAWVLAHEVAHVTGRHHRSGASQNSIFRGMSLFPKEDEREADDLGTANLMRAGFDAACGARALLAFEAWRAAQGYEAGIFDSHPEPFERLERLRSALALDRRPTCASSYLDRVAGLDLGRDSVHLYLDDTGAVVLRQLGLRVSRDAHDADVPMQLYRRGAGASFPKQRLELSFSRPPGGLARGRDEALGWQFGTGRYDARKLSYEEPECAGRASVRLTLQRTTKEGERIEQYWWIQDGGSVFRLSASAPESDWPDALPVVERFAAKTSLLTSEELRTLPLRSRLALHDVAAGETLESISQHYGVWTPAELALHNRTAEGAVLSPGDRLKVAEREPLAAPRR